MRRLLSLVVVLGLALVWAGCGGSDSSDDAGGDAGAKAAKVSIDVGTGTPIEVSTSKPRIAFFSAGEGNLYLKSYASGVEQEADRLGLELTKYDAQFDPARQAEQVQNALQRGGFDAYLVAALDGNQMCPVLTRQAPAKGIPVVAALAPLCNRGLNDGDEMWAPGTVSLVQFDSAVADAKAWYDEIAKRLPGEHKVAVLSGPPIILPSQALRAAQEYAAKTYPNLKFEATLFTDLTTPDGLAKTQTLLQAHPDVDAIVSNYSDLTVGAIKAIEAAGREGEIKLFEVGGSRQSVEQIQSGVLTLSWTLTPVSNGAAAVRAIADAFAGREVPRYLGVYAPGGSAGKPLMLDADNVDSFQPEY